MALWDRWYSSELKLVMLGEASGPYGKHTAKIQDLRLGDPDPALVTIPANYKIIDLRLPSQQ